MISIELIWPYNIVKNEDGFYGITDNAGSAVSIKIALCIKRL